jgi:arylsulfatase A-like enzyme
LLAAAHHLDSAIGDVVNALERSDQRDNTLILFSSDNGPQGSWGGNAYPDDLKLTDFNQPLPMRGKKVDVWEGGIHVPGFLNWPGVIAPKRIDTPVHIIDWFPTLAALLNSGVSDTTAWDGIDILPLVFGDGPPVERDLYWLWRTPPNRWALRFGDWKIVKYGTRAPAEATSWKLFNLKTDPKEEHDVSAQNTEIAAALHMRFLAQQKRDKQIGRR